MERDKRHHEVQIPHWLLSLIEKCLQKRPEDRFSDGRELHEYILLNSTLTSKKEADIGVYANTLQADNDQLLREKDHLQQLVLQYSKSLTPKTKS
jgi:serine/threonine-protein kinase